MGKNRRERKSDPRRDRIERGRTLLAAWGLHDQVLPASLPPAQVVEALSPFIGRDAVCDLLIAEWLGRLADPAAAERLAAWEGTAEDREVKREIRRSLFRLEQKGIVVPRREEPKPSFTFSVESAEPEGWVGPVDGEGSRMAWLTKRDRGGLLGLFTVINDREGMIFVDAGTLTRPRLNDQLRDLDAGSPGAPVRVRWTYADALMQAAFRVRAPKPGAMKTDYLLSRAEFTSREADPVPPCPIREIVAAADVDDPGLLENSASLFREREFRSWSLPDEIARVRLQEYLNATQSTLILSKEAATERVVRIMDGAMEDLAGDEWRPLIARRLEETALVLHLKERAEPARTAFAVALALEDGDRARLGKIPFLRGLIFRAFAPHIAAGRRAQEAGSTEPSSEMAEGSSRILDPSKVHESGVEGAGPVDGGETDPPRIDRP